MNEIKLVIFDCDGVLIDSEIIAAKAELEIYSAYGIEIGPEEFSRRFAGKDSADIFSEMTIELGRELPETVLSEVRANVEEKCSANAPMIAGADAVLDQFDQARCVCSNSSPQKLKAMLSRSKLYDRFRPYVYSANDFDPPAYKPKPDLITKALREFSVSPSEALVVEDSVHGIEAARFAGARVIGFTGASHTYLGHADELTNAGAETVINRLTDLPPVLTAFGQWSGFSA